MGTALRIGCNGIAAVALIAMTSCGSSSTPATGGSGVAKETLVWSDEFTATTAQSQPNPLNWTYDTGAGGWGNQELETYCGWGATTAPCDAANPSAYVGNDGYLHIVARTDSKGNFTSARLKTQGLQSFQYGRIEARIQIPAGQGMWPAFWMLGNNITSAGWPACGELDIMENIGKEPGIVHGSIHGPNLNAGNPYSLPATASFSAAFHTYGMIWAPNKVQYYVDDPANIYATFTPPATSAGGTWPFEQGKFFFILNVAVGGSWPGPPDATTAFPQQMLVDYVRVYSEPGP
ncbi:MAG TPA: glycoside hydrolase family 16 protein [Acidisarcina sp.]